MTSRYLDERGDGTMRIRTALRLLRDRVARTELPHTIWGKLVTGKSVYVVRRADDGLDHVGFHETCKGVFANGAALLTEMPNLLNGWTERVVSPETI